MKLYVLFVESSGVSGPKMLGMVQEKGVIIFNQTKSRKDQSVDILPEKSMSFEEGTIFIEDWGNKSSFGELIDKKP